MSKMFHLAAAAVFAAIAAASLISLATAAPLGAASESNVCQKSFCLVAFF